MDLSAYKLNNTKEIAELVEKYGERFGHFMDSVYRVLDNLQVGEKFDVVGKVHAENQELFIKCACFYIIDKNRCRNKFDSWIEAGNDYTFFRRMPSCHPTAFHKKRKTSQCKTK